MLDRTDNGLYNSRRLGRADLPTKWSQSELSDSDMKGQNYGIKIGYYERMKFRTSRNFKLVVPCIVIQCE